jgi:hypothetical protein
MEYSKELKHYIVEGSFKDRLGPNEYKCEFNLCDSHIQCQHGFYLSMSSSGAIPRRGYGTSKIMQGGDFRIYNLGLQFQFQKSCALQMKVKSLSLSKYQFSHACQQ